MAGKKNFLRKFQSGLQTLALPLTNNNLIVIIIYKRFKYKAMKNNKIQKFLRIKRIT